jgi:hypothetical protein
MDLSVTDGLLLASFVAVWTIMLAQRYLKDRLALHGIECIVPSHEADLDGIFHAIK